MTPRDPEIPHLEEPTHEGFGPRGYPLTLSHMPPRVPSEGRFWDVDFDGFASADLDED